MFGGHQELGKLIVYLQIQFLIIYRMSDYESDEEYEEPTVDIMLYPGGTDIYGTYLALVYLTPFFGGLLADRILGYRKSIFSRWYVG